MFVDWLTSMQGKVTDTNSIRHYLLLGFSKAHASIIEGLENDPWSCGTTTLLGGMLVEVSYRQFLTWFINRRLPRALKISKRTRCFSYAHQLATVRRSTGASNLA